MENNNRQSLSSYLLHRFLLRWAINAFALWLAGQLLSGVQHGDNWVTIFAAALALSAINAILKPIVTILALPAILLTLGLFTIVVNGLMVYLVSLVVDSFQVRSLGWAVLAGMLVSLVNYTLTTYLEERMEQSS